MSGELLGRVLLPVPVAADGVEHQFSAAALGAGWLWLAGDELISGKIALGRLKQQGDNEAFARYAAVDIDALLALDPADGEADIEGMDWQEGCLWLVGSHSRRRKKPRQKEKSGNAQKAITRLAAVEAQTNRFLLARLPIVDGSPVRQQRRGKDTVTAARLKLARNGNPLMLVLAADPHLQPFVLNPGGTPDLEPLPAKENGLDIEGLAVRGDRLYLGLRGPVLVGWAIILEVAVGNKPDRQDRLVLNQLAADGRRFRKHFLDLDGLGVRDLLFADDGALLILAGATMTLDAVSAVYRWRPPPGGEDDTISWQGGGSLQRLFTLPLVEGGDRAEGLCRFSWQGQPALMVVYDAPAPSRQVAGKGVYADVFRLSPTPPA